MTLTPNGTPALANTAHCSDVPQAQKNATPDRYETFRWL